MDNKETCRHESREGSLEFLIAVLLHSGSIWNAQGRIRALISKLKEVGPKRVSVSKFRFKSFGVIETETFHSAWGYIYDSMCSGCGRFYARHLDQITNSCMDLHIQNYVLEGELYV